jgi:hypothetical protein
LVVGVFRSILDAEVLQIKGLSIARPARRSATC